MTDGGRRSALAAQKNVPQLEETCKTFALFDGKESRHYVA